MSSKRNTPGVKPRGIAFDVAMVIQYRIGDNVTPAGVAAAVREFVSHFLEVEVPIIRAEVRK